MICISLAQESRRLVLVDVLNAAPQCDLLEFRLDCFGKAPDIGDLIAAARPKPVIISCRRQQDGGNWRGTEEERLAILRQAIICKADYVEIELDAADQIRKMPPTQRVISYTNLQETPPDIAELYAEAQSKSADVVKIVTPVRTPEEVWPLVQIQARPALPTVVVGLGKAGVMLAILGRRMGAPWTYAALEQGMEAYPGQPTVHQLKNVYDYGHIGRQTRFVGVLGMGERELATIAALNTGFRGLESPLRCLPLQVGSMKVFRKVMDAVKLSGLVVDEEHRRSILEVAAHIEPAAELPQAADLLVHEGEKWCAYNTLSRAAITALEATLRSRSLANRPLEGRQVMIVGTNAMARSLAHAIRQRGGAVIFAGHDRKAIQQLAQIFQCRHVALEALYTTMHDVLVVCGDDGANKEKPVQISPGYLKPSITVMDLSGLPRKTDLLREALSRGCLVVSPWQVLLDQLEIQARMVSGKEIAREPLEEIMADIARDDD